MSFGCRLDMTGLSSTGMNTTAGSAGAGGSPVTGAAGAGGIPISTTGQGGAGGGPPGNPADAGGIDASSSTGGSGGSTGGSGGSDVEAGAPDAVVVADAGGGADDAQPPPRSCGGNFGACPSLLEFCERPAGTCGGTGVCVAVPLPGTCATMGPRVCGCDGHVYLNDCFRQQARVSNQNNGNCN
jgi:hypothetical protein